MHVSVWWGQIRWVHMCENWLEALPSGFHYRKQRDQLRLVTSFVSLSMDIWHSLDLCLIVLRSLNLKTWCTEAERIGEMFMTTGKHLESNRNYERLAHAPQNNQRQWHLGRHPSRLFLSSFFCASCCPPFLDSCWLLYPILQASGWFCGLLDILPNSSFPV